LSHRKYQGAQEKKRDSNLCGLAALDDTGVRRFLGHIVAPYFECFYLLFESVVIKIDVELFHITYLRMIEHIDVLDGFSKGRKVRKAEADDTFRRLDPEFRLESYIVVKQGWANVPAIPGVMQDRVFVQPGKTERVMHSPGCSARTHISCLQYEDAKSRRTVFQ
jgi:hypothetical protein